MQLRSTLPLTAGLALVATATAVYTGLSLAAGQRLGVVLPLAGLLGIAVGALALTRFAGYVLLMLAVRPMVDLVKLSGRTAGTADGGLTGGGGGVSRALDPSTLLAVLFLLAAALWLAAQAHRNGRLRTSPLGLALLMVGGTAVVSALGADDLTASLLEALRILTVVAMFVVLEQMMDGRMARRVLLASYLSLALALAYTLVVSALGHPPAEDKGSFLRISGPFTQSTTFGRYLMFLLIFGVAAYRYLPGRHRAALAALLVPSAGLLLLTNTRSAIIAAVIGLIVVAVVQRSARLIAMLCVVAVIAVALLPAVADRFAELGQQQAVGGGPTGNTLAWRLRYWGQVVTLADRNPVTGIGPNMTQRGTDEAKKPHNDFLRAYVETGVLGLLAYLAMVLLLVRTGVHAVRRAPPDSLARGVAVGFLGCAVAFVAVSAVSNVLSNVVTLWYLVAFAALATAVVRGEALETPRGTMVTTWR